jgi:hypothetical protein
MGSQAYSEGDAINSSGQVAGWSFYAYQGPPPPIPEPSTWAMILTGFTGLTLAGYRRTKAGRAAYREGKSSARIPATPGAMDVGFSADNAARCLTQQAFPRASFRRRTCRSRGWPAIAMQSPFFGRNFCGRRSYGQSAWLPKRGDSLGLV